MTSPTPKRALVRFAGHRFDLTTGELSGPTGTVRLQPQPAQVLGILVARAGQLVTREELKQAVWPATVVEGDQGLNFCIRQIRVALRDEAESGRFIETLPRRGYRFVATVDEGPEPITRRPHQALIGAAVALTVAAGGWLLSGRAPAGTSRMIPVAILPLATPEADPWMNETNREITERLVVALAAADSGRFGVVGPATTSRLANDPRPHPEIGRELGVGYVISGGIRPLDSTLFVQAVRVTDGVHVFAFRRPVIGIGVDSVVLALVAGLKTKLGAR